MIERYFSVAEANALLPQVNLVVEEILAARQRIIDGQADLWPILEKSISNGGSQKAGRFIEDFKQIERGAHKLADMGCQLKDINTGLVDFPALREGKQILLCWRYGESEVAFWHDQESGFAGRQPL